MNEIVTPAVYRAEADSVTTVVSRIRFQFPRTVIADFRVLRVYDRQQTAHLFFGQSEPIKKKSTVVQQFPINFSDYFQDLHRQRLHI